MSDDARVCELVEQVLNEELTPEVVCASDPELLEQVKSRIRRFQSVDALLEKLFPSDSGSNTPKILSPETHLPVIPGFKVLGMLGRGGIGVIYRVRHVKLNRVSALKMLLSGAYASPTELARFTREARAVAALKHQNIVQIYDVYEHEGRPYFTMELIEGGSLGQKIAIARPEPRRAAEIVCILARAVHAAHQAGIVHRDLKPGNVLLTNEGVPKITDFGLATRFADEPSITRNEARLGTPSYMAPEQITGSAGVNGPAVDTYALGAILYEMLAGKPPFQGATPLETIRKVTSDEPARLNGTVPRDLETICLKCLSKAPTDRYDSAAALADDLEHFLHFQPIAARPTGYVERSRKWLRREPAIAVAAALAILLAGFAAGMALWVSSQRARLALDVGNDLSEVSAMDSAGRWSSADAALHRAEARLDVLSSAELRERVMVARTNLNLAAALDATRQSRATAAPLPYYVKRADSDYESLFGGAMGISVGSDVNDAVRKIKVSPVSAALLEALDDWACATGDPARRQWILTVARGSDPDPDGWRDNIRDPSNWANPKVVENLATDVPPAKVPVSTLLIIAARLRETAQDSCPFLRRVQEEHPADFYANLALGDMTLIIDAREAGVYYRAALAARPDAAVGYSAVGDSLRTQNRLDEAIEYYTKALALNPNYARAKCDLGGTLLYLGRFAEAIQACRESLSIDPNYAWANYYLGGAFSALGQMKEAAENYAVIFKQAPKARGIPDAYRGALIQSGGFAEAGAVWKNVLESPTAGYDLWTGYPELCLLSGNVAEYRRARAIMLDRFGAGANLEIRQQIARTCLLLPASAEDRAVLDRATAMADQSLSSAGPADMDYPFYLFVKALADYRNGDLNGALAIMNGRTWPLMGPCPKLLTAMILNDQHDSARARRMLADAIVKWDWRPKKADYRDIWIYHVLRREAEDKILPDLPALLSGARQPQGNDERLAILGACQFQGLNERCAEAFQGAWEAEPKIIAERNLNVGFVAACASSALLQKTDDRAQYEESACQWLSAVIQREMRHPRSSAGAREWLRRDLLAWKQDPGLTDLRDATPPRPQSVALWKSVDELVAALQPPGETAQGRN